MYKCATFSASRQNNTHFNVRADVFNTLSEYIVEQMGSEYTF